MNALRGWIFFAAMPIVAAGMDFPREHVYDTAVGPDETAVNVSLVNHRWPDCTTLESAMADIFRIEGVADRQATSDQARVLALWKWFRILVSATGGYAYEGTADDQKIVFDPHKIFTVYGHHMCDGLSWAMVPLWRAAGYMAFDQCTHGHTIASLRYRDDDGTMRYHDFDPQARVYYWNADAERVGTWTIPTMSGRVYRHVTAPQRIHSLRSSLRVGEEVRRVWDNTGHIVPGRSIREPYTDHRYYVHRPDRTDGVYAIVGEQFQTFAPAAEEKLLRGQLYKGSVNATVSEQAGEARFHSARAGEPGVFVFRLAPPFPVVDLSFSATLHKAQADDVCRISMRRDGGPWTTVFEMAEVGSEDVRLELGRQARLEGLPDAFTAYDVQIKAEFLAQDDPAETGMTAPTMRTARMFNKRTQPNLMPDENIFRVDADRLAPGWAIELTLDYKLGDDPKNSVHVIDSLPYYFRIDAPETTLRTITNYDQDFGNEEARTIGYAMRLVPSDSAAATSSLPSGEGELKFAESCPHPADMTRRRLSRNIETDPMQTSGFFPQSRKRKAADARMDELIDQLGASRDSAYSAWNAAQALGDYPAAAAVLAERLETANIDLTLFLCKALAQIADPETIDPLLAKWRAGMTRVQDYDRQRGTSADAPGTRYIPDALAEIVVRMPEEARPAAADKIVSELLDPLPRLRFDFRFHIAHALGRIAAATPSPRAEQVLRMLTENDPFPAVQELAQEMLELIPPARGMDP